jgi:DNA-binding MarR family transcriptional regulator
MRAKPQASKVRGGRVCARGRDALPRRALQHFRLIFGSARRFDAEVRRTAGISGSVLWALSEIAGSAGTSVNSLAERMALHQTTASNIVNTLVERKLVQRSRDPQDQRVVRLDISAEGARLLGKIRGPHPGLLVDALMRLEEGAMLRLTESLARLIAEMRSTASTAAGETLLGE